MSFLPRACRATTSLSAALELTVLSFVAHPSCASAQKILLQSPGSLRRESHCPTKSNGGDRAAEKTLSSTGILSSVRPLEESESLCCEQRNSKTTVTHDATSLAVPFSIAVAGTLGNFLLNRSVRARCVADVFPRRGKKEIPPIKRRRVSNS